MEASSGPRTKRTGKVFLIKRIVLAFSVIVVFLLTANSHGGASLSGLASQATPKTIVPDCEIFNRLAAMGDVGYASLATGPPAPILSALRGDKPASLALGESGSYCGVSENNGTLTCRWVGGATRYDSTADVLKRCFANTNAEFTSKPEKTTVNLKPALIKIFPARDDLILKFVGSYLPDTGPPKFDIQNWTLGTASVSIDGSNRCDIAPAVTADGYMMGSDCTIELTNGAHSISVRMASGNVFESSFRFNGDNCVKILDGGLSFKEGFNCLWAPGKDK